MASITRRIGRGFSGLPSEERPRKGSIAGDDAVVRIAFVKGPYHEGKKAVFIESHKHPAPDFDPIFLCFYLFRHIVRP